MQYKFAKRPQYLQAYNNKISLTAFNSFKSLNLTKINQITNNNLYLFS